jgi:hypothetical protein
MRSKIILFASIISAVLAAGFFLPNLTYAGPYAGQMGSSQAPFGPIANSLGSTPILVVHGHGGWHGGWHGAARAFRGGRRFYGGGFYGGTWGYPYYYEPYYNGYDCDSAVWDPDLGLWICADTDYDLY